jgi:hypothetical protein
MLHIWRGDHPKRARRDVAEPLVEVYGTATKCNRRLQEARLGVIQHFGGVQAVSDALDLKAEQ